MMVDEIDLRRFAIEAVEQAGDLAEILPVGRRR